MLISDFSIIKKEKEWSTKRISKNIRHDSKTRDSSKLIKPVLVIKSPQTKTKLNSQLKIGI